MSGLVDRWVSRGDAQWMPDDMTAHCMECSIEFTTLTRKHHCRACGQIFCNDCSSRRLQGDRRVCDQCFAESALFENPGDVFGLTLLSLVHEKGGRLEEALRFLRAAMSEDPSSIEVQDAISRVLMKREERANASRSSAMHLSRGPGTSMYASGPENAVDTELPSAEEEIDPIVQLDTQLERAARASAALTSRAERLKAELDLIQMYHPTVTEIVQELCRRSSLRCCKTWLTDGLGSDSIQSNMAGSNEQRGVNGLSSDTERRMDKKDLSDQELPEARFLDDNANSAEGAAALRNGLSGALNDGWRLIGTTKTLLAPLRSVAEKRDLLSKAVLTRDSDVIWPVILFLEDTLSLDLFYSLIVHEPSAYAFLSAHYTRSKDFVRLTTLRHAAGSTQQECTAMLLHALNLRNPLEREALLELCISSLSTAVQDVASTITRARLSFLQRYTKEALSLLQRQVAIDKHDGAAAHSGSDLFFRQYPRWRLAGTPLLPTLCYCQLYHPTAPKEKKSSPVGIENEFDVSPAQSAEAQLWARARCGNWKGVRAMAQKRGAMGWGSTYYESILPWRRFAEVLATQGAPEDLINEFFGLVQPPSDRLALARLCRCHGVAIDTMVELGDRDGLLELRFHFKTVRDKEMAAAAQLREAAQRENEQTDDEGSNQPPVAEVTGSPLHASVALGITVKCDMALSALDEAQQKAAASSGGGKSRRGSAKNDSHVRIKTSKEILAEARSKLLQN